MGHTYLVKTFKVTRSLQDSYTVEADTPAEAKKEASITAGQDVEIEVSDLTVQASAGATGKDEPKETAPMDGEDAEVDNDSTTKEPEA